jgi:hypothetical protein
MKKSAVLTDNLFPLIACQLDKRRITLDNRIVRQSWVADDSSSWACVNDGTDLHF